MDAGNALEVGPAVTGVDNKDRRFYPAEGLGGCLVVFQEEISWPR
jgi:hypothetical protein